MNRKGMSQVLALIMAASVLMMTALTVIFMLSDTADSSQQNVNQGGCTATLNAICNGDETRPVPPNCNKNQVQTDGSGQVDCSQYS